MAHKHKYSRRSIGYLNKCEPVLRVFAERLLDRTPFDISILSSTVRTEAQQLEYVTCGKSKTMKSMHLPGCNGKVRAIDAMPYIPGMSTQDVFSRLELFEEMHECAWHVAHDMNLNIRSGITWSNLNSDEQFHSQLQNYRKRKYDAGGRPFFDGPHFELYAREYP